MVKGIIYTFYSYKGGVGRSMALANIGMYFYQQGFNTLLVDWDLEAPGIERYFARHFDFDVDRIKARPGLVDMIKDYMHNASSPAKEDGLETDLYPKLSEYLFRLSTTKETSLTLLHAGRRTEGQAWKDYVGFVQNFDWTDFYQNWEGGRFFEWLRKQLAEFADVILIDSRTGITEMGGVATQHLAEIVILLCGANYENIQSTAAMARNFISEVVKIARDDRPLEIIIVPARIDDADSKGFEEFIRRCNSTFKSIPMRVLDDGYSMTQMLIPYLPSLSYEETLVVDSSSGEVSARRILESYRRIAANMQSLAPEGSRLNSSSRKTSSSYDPSIFLVHSILDENAVGWLTEQLRNAGITVRYNTQEKTPYEEVELLTELAQVTCVVALVSKSFNQSNFVRQILFLAEDAQKPIIPVLFEPNQVPLQLAQYQYIDFIQNRNDGVKRLINTVMHLYDEKPITTPSRAESFVVVSYAAPQIDVARNISRHLKINGIATWLYTEDLLPGSTWRRDIENALNKADGMVLLLSEEATTSPEVEAEWNYMLQRKIPVIPILVSNTEIPYRLRSLQVIDIRNNLDQGMDRLVQTLKRILYS
jgi:cellulose biosynthesis protein BcsQ